MPTKAELIEKANKLGLEADMNMKVDEINALISDSQESTTEGQDSPAVAESEEVFAKSGKRSAKAAREAEEDAEKEARKEAIAAGEIDESGESIKRGPVPVTRPLIERRSKRYQEEHKAIDKNKSYPMAEAIKLAAASSKVKFDASVEVHYNLGVDPKQADQNIRGTIGLPNGTGKKVVVAVLCDDDEAKAAQAAGADFAGDEAMAKVAKSELDFDVLIATPTMMPKLGKFARELGPRGLMPSPKSGTVTAKPAEAVKAAKAGQVEYRVDKNGNIHCNFGKVSFGDKKLVENYQSLDKAVRDAKPNSIKGNYINSIYVATTMGPSIRIAA